MSQQIQWVHTFETRLFSSSGNNINGSGGFLDWVASLRVWHAQGSCWRRVVPVDKVRYHCYLQLSPSPHSQFKVSVSGFEVEVFSSVKCDISCLSMAPFYTWNNLGLVYKCVFLKQIIINFPKKNLIYFNIFRIHYTSCISLFFC